MSGTASVIERPSDSASPWRGAGDFVLPGLILAIVALMILPLPLIVLDFLLAINISLGVVLVLMAIFVSSPLQFSVFPSVLLISTLFRLALSVATTRMILLHADAGSIIDTFGQLVAGGNIVVGMVVFLIITIVQFLVIAKGAERVAEVGARFSLDAMPGKQMSIDSDLRSGLIDKQEAKRKREELELESQLHGSMDGAMKFVKGDAIAGIVIIFVNLLGGLTIGITQLGLSAADAASIYSILTIGDGMVAQIPALFAAMSAGLIVSRVSREGSTDNLGVSIRKQITSIPRVLIIAGVTSFCFAMVPGFPAETFIFLGLVLVFSGAMLLPDWRHKIERVTRPAFNGAHNKHSRFKHAETKAAQALFTHTAPLKLRLPASVKSEPQWYALQEGVENVLAAYQNRIGLSLPELAVEWHQDASNIWQLHAFEVPVVSGDVSMDDKGLEKLCLKVDQALIKNGHLFVGIQEVSTLISKTNAEYPDIVREALRVVQLSNLTVILRKLVEEDLPVRNMRLILEALMSVADQEKDNSNLAEIVRIALAREISYRYAPDGTLKALTLSPPLEEKISAALRKNNGTQQMALTPELRQQFRAAVSHANHKTNTGILLVPVAIRRHCLSLLSDIDCELTVLSYNELSNTVNLEVQQVIDIEQATDTANKEVETDKS